MSCEEEAFFLFAVYHNTQLRPRVDGKYDVYDHKVEVKRATIQKICRDREEYKRIRVDFDPLTRQLCYIVGCLYSQADGNVIYHALYKPIGITETEEEAVKLQEILTKIKCKSSLEKREKFEEVIITPVLITRN